MYDVHGVISTTATDLQSGYYMSICRLLTLRMMGFVICLKFVFKES